MTISVMAKPARLAMTYSLAWLCGLPLSLGIFFVMMATGLQASTFGEHFVLEIIMVNAIIALCLMFGYEIQSQWRAHRDQIAIGISTALMVWLMIELTVLAVKLALGPTVMISFPHWLALLLAVAAVAAIRFGSSFRARSRCAAGGAQIGATGIS